MTACRNFVDAWGTPIDFLRWPVGFTDSELNGAGGILSNSGGSGITVLTVNGSTAQFGSYGLSSRNNAYAGRTITIYSPPVPPLPPNSARQHPICDHHFVGVQRRYGGQDDHDAEFGFHCDAARR